MLWVMDLRKVLTILRYMQKKYFRNFTETFSKFVLSLHYNGDESYLLTVDKN